MSRFDFEAGGFGQGCLTRIKGEELRGAERDRHAPMQIYQSPPFAAHSVARSAPSNGRHTTETLRQIVQGVRELAVDRLDRPPVLARYA